MGAAESVPAPTAYRVTSVDARGPCAHAISFPDAASARAGMRAPAEGPLVPWLDFIVSINGRDLRGPDGDDVLEEELANVEGDARAAAAATALAAAGALPQPEPAAPAAPTAPEAPRTAAPVILEVWNVKRGAMRTVQVLVPAGSRLGLQVQSATIPPGGLNNSSFGAEEVAAAGGGVALFAETVMHVIEVDAGSPAASAGLRAGDDYILASLTNGAYEDVEAFGEDVAQSVNEAESAGDRGGGVSGVQLPLYVYRATTDCVRIVRIPVPCGPWRAGPDARPRIGLGLAVACGKAHELPATSLLSDGGAEFDELAPAPPKVPEEQLRQQQALQQLALQQEQAALARQQQAASVAALQAAASASAFQQQQQQQQHLQPLPQPSITQPTFRIVPPPTSQLTPFGTSKVS
jgi:hypothetical protein